MRWWENRLRAELQKLSPQELADILGGAVESLSDEQFLAAASALKRDGQRRGLVPQTPAKARTGG